MSATLHSILLSPGLRSGGIDVNNINDVVSAGAERVAVVRAIMQAEQPTLMTQYFLSQTARPKAGITQSHV